MSRLLHILVWIVLFSPSSCARRGVVLFDPSAQRELTQQLTNFEEYWLHPAKIAPPTIPYDPVSLEVDGMVAYAQPFLLEDADWNSWEGTGFRLFNNRLGLGFRVGISGDADAAILWRPESTFVEINTEDDINYASMSADAMLGPLHAAALDQERGGLDGDFVDRLRSAHAFRDAYVPASAEGEWTGVIVFPETQPGRSDVRIAGDVRLTVTVQVGPERRIFVWTFD